MGETAADAGRVSLPEKFSAPDHGGLLHPKRSRGTISLAFRQTGGEWNEKVYSPSDLPSLLKQVQGLPDVYLSQQRFRGWRRVCNLQQLGACYLDLDYHNTVTYGGRSASEVCTAVLLRLKDAGLPQPWVISTGRGLHLLWALTPTSPAALPRWQAVQEHLGKSLHGFGVDHKAKDAGRVLRVVGSCNSRADPDRAVVYVLHRPTTERWSFEDLAHEVLPLTRGEIVELREEWAKRRKQKRQGRTGGAWLSEATLWATRLDDLKKLLHHRWWGTLPPGQRDHWLFIACVAISWQVPPDKLKREFNALARMVGGWDEAESKARMSEVFRRAEAAIRGEKINWRGKPRDPRYWFKADTIIDHLEITEQEMREAGLRDLATPKIKREIKTRDQRQRRRQSGVAERRLYREQVRAGSAEAERPWERLDMSRATWYRKGKPNPPETAENSV